jgi:hypothetical protein
MNDHNGNSAAFSPDRRSRRWEIIVIDQEPLRAVVRSRCRKAMSRLEKMRGRLTFFEREDKPAFTRWMAQEFGPLLTRAREIDAQIRGKQTLLHEVEEEMRRSFCDPQSAYQRVMHGRANPANGCPPVPPNGAGNGAAAAHLSDFEKEMVFQDWLRQYFGVDPDKMDDVTYETTFSNFRFHMFGDGAAEQTSDQWISKTESRKPPDPRLKEMYRLLVRRLHPDIRGDVEACTLWHDVQKAYMAGDIERMETLVALTDIQSDNLGAQTTLFRMRAVRKELKQAVHALRLSLRTALANDAWDFSRRGANQALRTRVEQNLELDLEKQRRTLNYLTQIIAQWSNPPAPIGHDREVVTESAQFVS